MAHATSRVEDQEQDYQMPQRSSSYMSLVPPLQNLHKTTNFALNQYFCLIGIEFSWGCTTNADSRGYAEAWKSIPPNVRGHTKAWESITPTQGATPKRGSKSEVAQIWAS